MTENFKCPFCQQELRNCCAGVIYTCSKPDSCPHEQCYGSKELWQELIRTKELLEVESSEHELCHDVMVKRTEEVNRIRKALEIAVDALKYANKCIKGGCVNWETEIDKALEQITALEQKDAK